MCYVIAGTGNYVFTGIFVEVWAICVVEEVWIVVLDGVSADFACGHFLFGFIKTAFGFEHRVPPFDGI